MASNSKAKLLPEPAAPPYMTTSQFLDKNSSCGPGCGLISTSSSSSVALMKHPRLVTIYQWVCPQTGLPVYVGKTVNFHKRIYEHKHQALRHARSAKDIWLRNELEMGRDLLVTVIDRVPIRRTKQSEAAAIQTARMVNPDLFNIMSTGAQRVGVKKRVWDFKFDEMLGKISDPELARRTGNAVTTVTKRRLALSIPSFRGRRWTDDVVSLLGKVPDDVIAARLGIFASAVQWQRTKRGISRWRDPKSANDRAEIIRLKDLGLSRLEIINAVQASSSTVNNVWYNYR